MAKESQRAHERVDFAVPIRVNNPASLEGMGVDLGAGGMALHLSQPVPEGSAISIEPFGDGQAVQGTVRKSQPHADGGFRLGIQFHEENGHLVARWMGMRK